MILALAMLTYNLLLDYLHSDLDHYLSNHQHEELSQQVHQCEVHHLCFFVDHQPVTDYFSSVILHLQ